MNTNNRRITGSRSPVGSGSELRLPGENVGKFSKSVELGKKS